MKTSCERRETSQRRREGGKGERKRTYELVETPDGAPDSLPHRQEQTNRRERLLTSRQALGVLMLTLLVLASVLGLNGNEELAGVVVEAEFAGEVAVSEVRKELSPGALADVVAEVGPAQDTVLIRGAESLRGSDEWSVPIRSAKGRTKRDERR